MNQTADETWHYTHEGERVGPVSFSTLRIKAGEGALHPRLDMVWTQGMAEWKPAGEVDGLFERKVIVEEQPAPVAPDPYTPPTQQEAAEMLTQTGNWPGERRRGFYLATVVFPIIGIFGISSAVTLLRGHLGQETREMMIAGAVLLLFILMIYSGIQRLANVGMSRWWYLGNLVPILNLWVSYRMYVCPAGYAYHKKLDTAGVILAILFWLMIVLVLLSVIAMIAVIFGMAGNPEIQKQFNDAFQEALKQQPAGP